MTSQVNVVASPQVTGNIGSCTTNVVSQQVSRNNLFTSTYSDIATNSCTGHQYVTNYWDFTGSFWLMCILAGLFMLGIVAITFDRKISNY